MLHLSSEQATAAASCINPSGTRPGRVCVQSEEERARESERMLRQQVAFAASREGREWGGKRAQLPVIQVREKLLDALRAGDCAVLSGDTGCGKTTQVPQYILEAEIAAGRGGACQIICTQPRRIAATSVAERVAGRRGSRIGCAAASGGSRIGWRHGSPHAVSTSAPPRSCGPRSIVLAVATGTTCASTRPSRQTLA
jgi:HrpA-like RNA helicase